MMLRAKMGKKKTKQKKHISASGRQIVWDSDVNPHPCRDKSLFSRKAARRETFRP